MTPFHLALKLKLTLVAFSSIGLLLTPAIKSAETAQTIEPKENQLEQAEEPSNPQHIIITSRKSPLSGLAPTTQATFLINPENLPKIASSLTELIEGSPGVAENSQPGLFQVVSIRGVSRQRILTLLDGVRLSSERRAGTAASFIDPSLLQGISITRGPASSYYGSGAMGGVMQLDLTQILGHQFSAGFDSTGNENYQNYSWGTEHDSSANHFSVVRRQAENSEDINGADLNTHFEQLSALYQNSVELHDVNVLPLFNHSRIDSWLFTSKGTDLGRSNIRFPNRIVNVPNEAHHIFKTSVTSTNQWSADFYFHDQSITTQTIRPNQSIIDVTNESQDFGVNWQLGWSENNNNKNSSNLFGIDFYTRKNVNSDELKNDLIENNFVQVQTLNNAQKNELAAFYSTHFQYDNFRVQAGGRYTLEQSKNANIDTLSNNALTAFTGIAFNLLGKKEESNFLEINANIGSAFRFPSLTELYFSGTTARGEIRGNSHLDAEESLNFEIGFNWKYLASQLKMTVFENHFDNYIERITVGINEQNEDILTFVNQQDGKIKGLETEYQYSMSNILDLNFIATKMEGKNGQNQPLSDIPSDRASLSFNYHNNDLSAELKFQHRRTKTAFGSGELATKAANLLSASFQYQFNNHWTFKLVGENLLDTEYVASSDDLATLMPGRSFGISFVWHE
ncbi:MAG: TonB-dependent receptor plug domain-containing protein [Kangiellaceae bacterium]